MPGCRAVSKETLDLVLVLLFPSVHCGLIITHIWSHIFFVFEKHDHHGNVY